MNLTGSFLQTREWAQFQESLGRRTFFVRDGTWEALLIRHKLPLGKNYLYCPRGPQAAGKFQISSFKFQDGVKEFLEKVTEVAKQEKSIFFRWDPPFPEKFQIPNSKFQIHGIRSVQPQHTRIVDLPKSEEELLEGMHEKTRYNIRLAERKNVSVQNCPIGQKCTGGEFEVFLTLLRETTKRDAFSAHGRKHYEKLLETFPETSDRSKPFIRLYVAKSEHVPLAAALVMFYEDTATYLHGASSNTHREMMAPHLLHWRIIQDVRRMGYTKYDLWGIDNANPAWAGITRFKRGFGGQEISYADSVDIVFDPFWYKAYCVAKKFL